MSPCILAAVVLLLLPLAARADMPPCIQLYEDGQYTAAVQACEQLLARPGLSSEERGRARIYLAASLHVLLYLERAQEQRKVRDRRQENRGEIYCLVAGCDAGHLVLPLLMSRRSVPFLRYPLERGPQRRANPGLRLIGEDERQKHRLEGAGRRADHDRG